MSHIRIAWTKAYFISQCIYLIYTYTTIQLNTIVIVSSHTQGQLSSVGPHSEIHNSQYYITPRRTFFLSRLDKNTDIDMLIAYIEHSGVHK